MNAAAPKIEDHRLDYERPHLYPKQFAAIFDQRRYSIVEASTKSGKAQPLNSIVYTPSGPMRMGELAIGDYVLTPASAARITAIYPQGRREVLRVTFSDGSTVEADADHLWEVHQFKSRPQIVTTEQLQTWSRNKLHRTWVPEISPAQFTERHVPIDPYLLGALIGDGGMTGESVVFSNSDIEMLASVEAVLPDGHQLRHSGNYDWRITAGAKAATLREAGTHIRGMLQRLGLGGKGSHEKFVPDCYRYNSVSVRMSVLQGILDTDGFVDSRGQPLIEQTSERLARDIEELVQSLGGSVLTNLRSINGYRAKDGRFITCRPVYRQVIRVKDAGNFFRLKRKRDLCRPKLKTGHRMFRSIEFSRHADTQCIELHDERQLYLTDGFIPTHNTSGCIVWLSEQAFAGRAGWNYWWVAPVSSQADIAFRRALRAIPRDMCRANLSLKTITLVTGAVIWFKSADHPDSLYGEDVYAAVIDEASRAKEDAWHAVRSTLSATRGHIRIIGNVKGRRGWFYQLARKAELGDPAMGYHKLVAADAVAAGVLNEEEIEDARRILPDAVFRELYLAEASDDEGNPFGLKAIENCVSPLSNGEPNWWGWDLAKKKDWTVGIALDKNGKACRFERFQRPWPETLNAIERATKSTLALVDSTGVGDPIVDFLQKRDNANYEGYLFTGPSKQKLMEGLAVAIQSGNISYPDGPIKLELDQFEYEYRRSSVHYSAPDGFNDDCVCALALAVMCRGNADPNAYDESMSWVLGKK